ncbi:Expressed protein [Arabidopsis thaliana]|nr:uncharacterized protein AT4G28405 [Arabidopsis thaliana]AEE85482.2 Expressed protein [Arabidopsis thaliana]|eukprot:NP_974631.2 Expressed protein [Arabidopsis thaliana]
MMKVAFAMMCLLVAATTTDAVYRPWPPECVDVANVMLEQCKMFFVHQESPPTAECCRWFSAAVSMGRRGAGFAGVWSF